MIELHSDNSQHQLILYPNRSMSWQTNKKILLVMFIVNMTIALGWAALGAWMILPFAGLEIFLVGLGMYYVSWKISFKEVITLKTDSLILQKGVYFPKQEWCWRKAQTTLVKQPSKYRMSAPSLFLTHSNQRVEIGAFLNRSEKKSLRNHLTTLGIPITVSRQ